MSHFLFGFNILMHALAIFALAIAASGRTFTICSNPTIYSIYANMHARYAIEYYGPQFPGIDWQYRFLGPQTNTPKNFVAAWTVNGTQYGCDALMGPGSSSIAVALSPVVSTYWVDFAASTIELSDKTLYPYFSRSCQSDRAGATDMANLAVSYGWMYINILCDPTSYANSYSTVLTSVFKSLGGTISVQKCMGSAPTDSDMDAAIDAFLMSPTRVVMIAMSQSSATFTKFRLRLTNRSLLNGHFIYMFTESFCSGVPSSAFLSFDGALCATFLLDSARRNTFEASFLARNTTNEALDLADHGWDVATVNFSTTDVFSAFAVDSVYLIMSAAWQVQQMNVSLSAIDAVAYMRTLSFAGLTGFVSMDRYGDRTGGTMMVYNVQNGSMTRIVAYVSNTSINVTDTAMTNGVYVLGSMNPIGALAGLGLFPVSKESSSLLSPQNIMSICVGCVFILVVVALVRHVSDSAVFKRLVRSGLWMVVVQVIVIGGSIILRVTATLGVALGSYPVGFAVCYILLSSLSVVIHGAEAGILLLWFMKTVYADDDLSENETIEWEFRVAQTHLISAGIDDIPLIAMNFAAMLQESVTFTVLGSMGMSCIFLGMKFTQLKDRIMRYLNAPPQPMRRFHSLRAVALHIIIARRFNKNFSARGLGRTSTQEELLRYRQVSAQENPERVRYLRKAAKHLSVMLDNKTVVGDEFFAFVREYLREKFDPSGISPFAHQLSPQQAPLQSSQVVLSASRSGNKDITVSTQQTTTSASGAAPTDSRRVTFTIVQDVDEMSMDGDGDA